MDSRDPITSVTSHCCLSASRSFNPSPDSEHDQVWFLCSLNVSRTLRSVTVHSGSRTEHVSWYVSLQKDFVDFVVIKCLRWCFLLCAVCF